MNKNNTETRVRQWLSLNSENIDFSFILLPYFSKFFHFIMVQFYKKTQRITTDRAA